MHSLDVACAAGAVLVDRTCNTVVRIRAIKGLRPLRSSSLACSCVAFSEVSWPCVSPPLRTLFLVNHDRNLVFDLPPFSACRKAPLA